jgi:beta-lactamase class A
MEARDRIPGQCNAHAWLKSGAIQPARSYPFARVEILALPDPASFSPYRPFAVSPFRPFAHSQIPSTTSHNGTTRILSMRLSSALLFVFLNLTPGLASALSLNTVCLETKLRIQVKNFNGRIGICVSESRRGVSINGNRRFPLHSVFNLAAALAVLDAVDKGQLRLDDAVAIGQNKPGMGVQPLAKLAGTNGFNPTILDVLFRMIVDSDSAATDALVTKVGGPSRIESVLAEKGFKGFKIDRNERDLDTEGQRDQGFRGSQRRDTGTPIAVANLLQWLANGQLLSRTSSALLLEALTKTRTYPERLRAGVPNGWLLAHETGTSSTGKSTAAATNDAGILMAPDASSFVVVVLVADSKASDQDRAALIAEVARAVGECSQLAPGLDFGS